MGHPHKKVDEKLLQMDKKFSDLKKRQQEKINEWITEDFVRFMKKNDRFPNKEEIQETVGYVSLKMNAEGIWLPEKAIKRHCLSTITRLKQKCKDGAEPKMFVQTEYSVQYEKEHTTRIVLKLNNTKDADLVEHLNQVGNRQTYLKGLIRADMRSDP